jgi:3-hydroxyisobutyrate dehydrogenase
MAKRLAIRAMEPTANLPQDVHPGARLHRGSEMHRGMKETVMRKVLVWNRTSAIGVRHAEEFRSVNISSEEFAGGESRLSDASIVFMCLPTSNITFDRVKDMVSHLADDTIIVDCCTGHPKVTREIAKWLREAKPSIEYMDCPISGGPGGASRGTLAAMLGGSPEVVSTVWPHISAFAANPVYLGPTGAGHAVKAINNACNVSNLLCLHEGLLALKKMGVDPTAALQVINKSSGRSLMSQDRVPQEVITGDFNYGFKLGLMAKDVSIATDLLHEYYPKAEVYHRTLKVHSDAMLAGTVSYDSDYTEIVKQQELEAGITLRTKRVEPEQQSLAKSKTLEALEAEMDQLRSQNTSLQKKLQDEQKKLQELTDKLVG